MRGIKIGAMQAWEFDHNGQTRICIERERLHIKILLKAFDGESDQHKRKLLSQAIVDRSLKLKS